MSTPNNAINNQIGTAGTTAFLSHLRSASGQWDSYNDQTDTFGFYNSAGSPEGVIAANTGSRCVDTTNGDLYIKSTDTVNTGWQLLASTGSFSTVIQVIDTAGAGTYTPTSGMVYCQIECVGGGGAGGGAAATAGGENSVGGGGGAGEYTRAMFSAATIGASIAVSVGAGGTGVSGAAGNNGGNTTVGSTILSAVGGSGGTQANGAGSQQTSGGAGGTGGVGADLAIPGGTGDSGLTTLGGFASGGNGGANTLGPSDNNGRHTVAGGGVGLPGIAYGSGGGGGANGVSSAARVGGDGADGVIVITEYVFS